MNLRYIFTPLLLSLLVATIVATPQPSSAIEPETGPAAFGEGEFRLFNNELISFSFEAHANEKRHARGRAVFDNLSTQTQVVVKIDCLRVDGFEALITGTVLHSNDPDFPKQADVIFGAFDGQGIRADTMTPLFLSPFPDCNTGASPLTIFRVGNIVVEP
jgi:hypothetical protein